MIIKWFIINYNICLSQLWSMIPSLGIYVWLAYIWWAENQFFFRKESCSVVSHSLRPLWNSPDQNIGADSLSFQIVLLWSPHFTGKETEAWHCHTSWSWDSFFHKCGQRACFPSFPFSLPWTSLPESSSSSQGFNLKGWAVSARNWGSLSFFLDCLFISSLWSSFILSQKH